jgi:ABC-type nitrate/sulfonate/bicarbonate transport system, permease component
MEEQREATEIEERSAKAARNRRINRVIKYGAPLAILLLWQLFSMLGTINASVLPSPLTIVLTGIQRVGTGQLPADLGISLLRVAQGYLLGALLGVLLGTGMAFSQRFESAFSVVFNLVRPIPIIAWVPIFIMWLGIGEVSKVTVITFGAFFPVLLNTIQGIRSTDAKLLEVARSFEKNRRRVFFSIILPSAMPAIFTGLRLGLGLAWMSVVAAEMIGASSGIGYIIAFAGQLSQPAVMLMGVLVIGLVGALIDSGLRALERRLMKWHVNSKGVS